MSLSETSQSALETAHLLQLPEWAKFKSHFGWQNAVIQSEKARAQVLFRTLPFGFSIAYLPKGPIGDNWSDLWQAVDSECKKRKAVFLQVEPDLNLPLDDQVAAQFADGFYREESTIQPRRTVIIPLAESEEDLLAAMKQKTRYNIRLAAKKGVAIREGSPDDLPMLYKMYAQTAVRDNFVIRHEEYYQKTWRGFLQADMAKILIAEVGGEPVSALILFHFNGVSRYMFGMSTDRCRELMPNHLLQWEAVRLSKALGCRTYDLWGAPDVFDASDSMWGVYRFKQGFNGVTARHLGAWDFSSRNFLYHSYTRVLPKLLDVMRSRGKAATQKQVQND